MGGLAFSFGWLILRAIPPPGSGGQPSVGVRRLTVPNLRKLKVGDYVRFTALPDEWNRPGYTLHRDSLLFMKTMIRRRFPSRVYEIDEYGTPWIAARIRRGGRVEHHTWGIFELTGWRRVRHRG